MAFVKFQVLRELSVKERVDHVPVLQAKWKSTCYFGWGNSKNVSIRRRRVSITLFVLVREFAEGIVSFYQNCTIDKA